MEEVYTCACGCQSWTIYGLRIECTKCGRSYHLWPKSPSSFNIDKEAHFIPKCKHCGKDEWHPYSECPNREIRRLDEI